MIMGIIISVFVLGLFIAAILKHSFFHLQGIPKWLCLSTLFLKIIAGLFLWWLYTYHYTDRSKADIYKYFDDAQVLMKESTDHPSLRWKLFFPQQERSEKFQKLLHNTAYWDRSDSFLFNDNRSIIKIHFLILFFSNGFFHLHSLIFILLSFLGSFALLKFFSVYSNLSNKILFPAIFLLPSTLLWTSGALKESWLFFCLGFFLLFLSKSLQNGNRRNFIGLVIFALLFLSSKMYIIVALIPALLFFIINHFSKTGKIFNFVIAHLASAFIFFLFLKKQVVFLLSQKQEAFIRLAEEQNANSSFEIDRFSSFSEMLSSIPNATYSVFLLPLFPTSLNPLSLLVAAEQLLLLIILLLVIFLFRKAGSNAQSIALFCFSFCLILGVLIGLTTPILGAIVRYKVPFLPFYVIGLLTFVSIEKVPLLKKLQ